MKSDSMHSYFEEDITGKIYDSTMIKWLLGYVKPHFRIIFLNFFLLLVLTGLNLTLPFIYKIGIDRYIYPSFKEIIRAKEIPEKFKNKIIITLNGRKFLDFTSIRETIKGDMENKGIISKEDFYFIRKAEGISEIIKKTENLEGENFYLIESSEISKLSIRERIILRRGDINGIKKLAFIYLGLIILIFLFNYVQSYQIQWIGQRICFKIREDIIRKFTTLPYSFFQKNPVGRLVTRICNDVGAIGEFFSEVLIYFGAHILTILGILGIMLFLSPILFFVILIIIPILVFLTFIFRLKAREVYREMRKKLATINSNISESISGISIIQAFVQEKRKEKEFFNINNDFYLTGLRMIKVFAVFRPLIDFVDSIGIALLIWFGGKGIISGVISFGTFVAFISYLERLFEPIRELSEYFNVMQSAMAAGERVYSILEKGERIPAPHISRKVEIKGKIEFQNVWFSYDGENWVLKDVSFTIEPGEKVGIVGHTGSGKTTIINLLLRLYDVQRGSIKLDGIDIREIDKELLRSNIATVFQEPFIFAGTILKNVNLWRNPDEVSLKTALYISNLEEVMKRRNLSLDFKVGEGGSGLSVGERQLVAFARSLIGNKPILVLDEATANIDPETEWLIQEALLKMIKGRTSLIIAHRLSTLRNIDSLIVVHKGEIVGRGTHRELMKDKKGIYYTLYKLQQLI
ncbi:MAG: ABC transporter ATP-binding protein [candidate division WOR-3 bacterium]